MSETDDPVFVDEFFVEGRRVGRYVLFRDLDGTAHAVASSSVAALCEADDGCVLMLPGGRLVTIPRSLRTVLGWLEVGTR